MSVSSITTFVNSTRGIVNDHIRRASVLLSENKHKSMCEQLAIALEVSNYAISYVNSSGFRNAISVSVAMRGIYDSLDTLEKLANIDGMQPTCHRYLNLKRQRDTIQEEEVDTNFGKRIRSLFN